MKPSGRMWNGWTAEDRLVVATAVVSEPLVRAGLIRNLAQQNIDWPAVVRSARFHGTFPLLAHHLTAHALDLVPQEAMSELKADCTKLAIRNLFLVGELVRVTRELSASGIRALSFKGPTLAQIAYGSLALRQFNDIDVLIPLADFNRTSEILCKLDYRPDPMLKPEQEKYHVERLGWRIFRSGVGGHIDLHVNLVGDGFPFRVPFDDLWSRRLDVQVAGKPVSMFSPEDLLLFLCLHGAKHFWGNLGWISDVGQLLLSAHSLDWRTVESRARELGDDRILWLGVLLARDVLQVPVPESLEMCGATRDAVAPLVTQFAERLFAPYKKPTFASRVRFQLQCRKRPFATLRWFIEASCLPHITDWKTVWLPRRLWFLYPIIRPFRLLSVRVLRLWRGLFRRVAGKGKKLYSGQENG